MLDPKRPRLYHSPHRLRGALRSEVNHHRLRWVLAHHSIAAVIDANRGNQVPLT
jgi:hypothetical protein